MSHVNGTATPSKTYNWRLFKRGKFVMNGCTVMAALAMMTQAAIAAPTGGNITSGAGSIKQNGLNTNISQQSGKLDINWKTFSSNANESINFFQPNSASVAINRVTGGVPSQLNGALNANGRVFVLNDSGVVFGRSATVNVGSLVATTSKDLSIDGDVFNFAGKGEGQVANYGNISVSQGGFAVLAAPEVINGGVVRANLGQVHLASTNLYTVDLRGDSKITYTVTEETLKKAGVTNTGTVQAKGGVVEMHGTIANDLVASVVNLDGIVDASGYGDGGSVLVKTTGDINQNNVTIDVSAGDNGKGGDIITRAGGTNNFSAGATLKAEGGKVSGDAGFIDVSGDHFILNGEIALTAVNGKPGTFLIDPADIVIKDGANPGVVANNKVNGADAGPSEVYEETIENYSQGGVNVLVEATDSITIEDLSDDEITGASGDIILRTLDADSSITFLDTNDAIKTTSGNIRLFAKEGGITAGRLITGGDNIADPGDIIVRTQQVSADALGTGNIYVQSISSVSNIGDNLGGLSLMDVQVTSRARGDIVIEDGINASVTAVVDEGDVYAVDTVVTVDARGSVTVNGDVKVTSSLELLNEVDEGAAGTTAQLFVIARSGDINVTGDVDVSSTSKTLFEDPFAIGYASAESVFDAGRDINLVGDASVFASAKTAEEFFLEEGEGEGEEVVVLTREVFNFGASGTADAEANLDFYAGGDILLTGDITSDAYALSENGGAYFDYFYGGGFRYDDSSDESDSDLFVQSGGRYIGGVSSIATSSINVLADGDVNIVGDIHNQAFADQVQHFGNEESSTFYGSLAIADTSVIAGFNEGDGNLTHTGGSEIYVEALGVSAETESSQFFAATGDVSIDSTASELGHETESFAGSSPETYLSTSSNDRIEIVAVDGDVNVAGDVTIDSETQLYYGGSSTAEIKILADGKGDINVVGDLAAYRNLVVSPTFLQPYGIYSFDDASVFVRGLFGDVNVTGDVTAQALSRSTSVSSYGFADVGAYVSISSLGDVAVTGDTNAIANSTTNFGQAYVDAHVSIGSGFYGGPIGSRGIFKQGRNDVGYGFANDVTVIGDTNAIATSVVTGEEIERSVIFDNVQSANAFVLQDSVESTELEESFYGAAQALSTVSIIGRGDITVTGDTKAETDVDFADKINEGYVEGASGVMIGAIAIDQECCFTEDDVFIPEELSDVPALAQATLGNVHVEGNVDSVTNIQVSEGLKEGEAFANVNIFNTFIGETKVATSLAADIEGDSSTLPAIEVLPGGNIFVCGDVESNAFSSIDEARAMTFIDGVGDVEVRYVNQGPTSVANSADVTLTSPGFEVETTEDGTAVVAVGGETLGNVIVAQKPTPTTPTNPTDPTDPTTPTEPTDGGDDGGTPTPPEESNVNVPEKLLALEEEGNNDGEQPNDEGLGDIAPAAGDGVEGTFCDSVNASDEVGNNICNDQASSSF